MILKKNKDIRFRYEYWGGLAWTPNGYIYELSYDELKLVHLLSEKRQLEQISEGFFSTSIKSIVKKLVKECIICKDEGSIYVDVASSDYQNIEHQIYIARKENITKPFWAHIQPYVFCNQNCIHCYCNGNSKQARMPLHLESWKLIVDRLKEFGILDIYITGGENLIVDGFFDLMDYIIQSGFGTGLSTNAMVVNSQIIDRLKNTKLEKIQVSLDGSNSTLNDYIRGTKNAFQYTLKGINKLSRDFEIVVNTVVNKFNVNDIENIVALGKSIGIREFKFFPQKSVGRGVDNTLLIPWDRWQKIDFMGIASRYNVEIDFLSVDNSCGSGSCGFAINEYGQIMPCIFGSHNPDTFIGNVLTDDLNDIWFNNEKLNAFRKMECTQPCRRCEVL